MFFFFFLYFSAAVLHYSLSFREQETGRGVAKGFGKAVEACVNLKHFDMLPTLQLIGVSFYYTLKACLLVPDSFHSSSLPGP